MGKKMLKFWSLLGGASLFIFNIEASMLDEDALGGGIFYITKFVKERTQGNLEAAVEGVITLLGTKQGKRLQDIEVTQLDTLANLARNFYEKQGYGEGCDVQSIGNLTLLLRPYEAQLGREFLDLQALYRESLLQGEGLDESIMRAEVHAVFYLPNEGHRPYLKERQAEWVLLLMGKQFDWENELMVYFKRAAQWKRRQRQREARPPMSDLSIPEGLDVQSPKRRWGNRGFTSHAGKRRYSSGHSPGKRRQYRGHDKSNRLRSHSW